MGPARLDRTLTPNKLPQLIRTRYRMVFEIKLKFENEIEIHPDSSRKILQKNFTQFHLNL